MSNKSADDAFKLIMHSVEDFRSHHDPDDLFMALQNEIPEAKQQLLADILSLMKECETWESREDGIEYYVFESGQFEQALSVYFMGGDVGVDMGSLQDNTTPTAQGHEAGNLSAGGTK